MISLKMKLLEIITIIWSAAVVLGDVRINLQIIEINLQKTVPQEGNTGRFKKVECEMDQAFFSNISCNIKPVNRTTAFLNIEYYAIKGIENLTLTLQIFKKETVHFRSFPVSFKINYCDFLKTRKSSSIVARLFLNFFLPYTNVKTCPLQGHLWFKDFNFSPNFLPSIWPRGYYKGVSQIYKKNIRKPIMSMSVYFELEEKNRLNNYR